MHAGLLCITTKKQDMLPFLSILFRNGWQRVALVAVVVLGSLVPVWAAADDLKPFPAPAADQNRWVIRLPALSDEDTRKVELIVGREMVVDCNRHGLLGKLEQKTVAGWGYSYVVLSGNGSVVSTRMGCPGQRQHKDFVTVQPLMLRYNSQLPLVVYAPKDMQVRYRLWAPQDKPATDAVQE